MGSRTEQDLVYSSLTPKNLHKTKLSNGLTVFYLYTKDDPISACHLFLPASINREAKGKEGLTTLLWSLLLKGTKKRTPHQLAEDIESIGASMGGGATHDYSEVSCHSVAEYFSSALEILSEALFEPAFASSEIQKEKNALIAAIESKKENIFSVANEEFNKGLFGKHSYGRPASGTTTSVASITQEELKKWHLEVIQPAGAIFSVASNLPFKTILPQLNLLFGKKRWEQRKAASALKIMPIQTLKTSIHVKRTEAFEQAYLILGFPAAAMDSKDYVPLKILNGVLGGGMSARLFQSLREKQGLAYDVGSFFPTRSAGSALIIHMGLQASRLAEAKKGIAKEIEILKSEKLPAEELEQTKNYLKGTYILDHQTNSQRAHYLGWWYVNGRSPLYNSGYIKALDRVSVEDVHRVANRYLNGVSVMVEILPRAKAELKVAGNL